MTCPKIGPMSKSNITWCDYSWHPVTGCSRVSPACERCYAEVMTGNRLATHPRYAGLTRPTPKGPRWTGTIKTHPDLLVQPRLTKKGGRVFVCGMSDLFHAGVPTEFIIEVFKAMHGTPRHQYLCLTKRPERIVEVERHPDFPGWAPHIWMGTTIESNSYVGRADHLRACGAQIKWISAEPLLGPLDHLDTTGIDWVVIAGESGHGARLIDLTWVDDLMARCRRSGSKIHVKQMGEAWTRAHRLRGHGTIMEEWAERHRVREYPGKGTEDEFSVLDLFPPKD